MNKSAGKIVTVFFGACFMLFFCLLPFIYMLLVSLSSRTDFLNSPAGLILTFRNFIEIVNSPSSHFIYYLRNSMLISLVSALLSVFIASLAAYAITRLAMPGKMGLLLFVVSVSMFPQISVVGYLFKFMSGLNWINTYQALVLPYVAWTLPLSLCILVSYFNKLPRDLDKAAFVDGCSKFQILFRVIIPAARPGVIAAFLLAFLFSYNEFIFALMLTIDHNARTTPVAIALLQNLDGKLPWGHIMAASVLVTLPIFILAFIYQRNIVSGLTKTVIKG
ncbi:MAG: carbohydrate ABC transporter permease [Candidatus Omnitrophota bacterium]